MKKYPNKIVCIGDVPDDAVDIWICDCDLKEYLVIEEGKFIVKTV